MEPVRFTIPHALLGGISGLVPGEKSPLSPLRISNPPSLTLEQRAELQSAGILSGDELTEPARLLLLALAEAPSFARLVLTSSSGYLDEAVHLTGEGSAGVAISNTAQGLVMSAPPAAEAILARVMEFTGSSTRPAVAWSAELLPLEAFALGIMLDLRRKAVLKAVIDNQPLVAPPTEPQALLEAAAGLAENPQWITAAIKNCSTIPSELTATQLQAALETLAQKGLAWRQNGGFMPAAEPVAIPDRMLWINNILTLDAGHANLQGHFNLCRLSWLQSSVTEMLQISPSGDLLRVETVSASEALARILIYLSNPEALPAPPIEFKELEATIVIGIGAGQVFPLGEETVLGRSEQAGIRILDSRASRRHSVIRKLPQGYQLNDAGSTNGTYLNDEFLTAPAWLHEGDVITIGETQIKMIRAGQHPQLVAAESTVFIPGGRPQPAAVEQPAPQPEPLPVPPSTFEFPQPPAQDMKDLASEQMPQISPEPPPMPVEELPEFPQIPVEEIPQTSEPLAGPLAEPLAEPLAAPEVAEFEPEAPSAPELAGTLPEIPPAPEMTEALPEKPSIPEAAEGLPEVPAIAEPVESLPEFPSTSDLAETLLEHPSAPLLDEVLPEPLQPVPYPEAEQEPTSIPFDLQPTPVPPTPEPSDTVLPVPPLLPIEEQPPTPPTPSVPVCPNCGNETSPGARFCGNCGTRLI